MNIIAKEHDDQRQIDRACAAQSPALLPETDEQTNAFKAAQKRIEEEKNQYD